MKEWQEEKVEEVGELMHHRDECEWVQRREEGEKTEDWKMKISCKNSHMGFRGSKFKSLFYDMPLKQDTVQDMADWERNVSAEDACGLSQMTIGCTGS